MKKLLIVFMLIVNVFAFDWAGKVNWTTSYKQAKLIAKQTNKLIFIDLSLSDCPPCKFIAKTAYSSDKVAKYMNKHFVNVIFIIDKQRVPLEVAENFGGSAPTLLLMDKNGKLIGTQVGLNKSWFNKSKNYDSAGFDPKTFSPKKFINFLQKNLK